MSARRDDLRTARRRVVSHRGGEDHVGLVECGCELLDPRRIVHEQHARPGRTAVATAIYAARVVLRVHVSLRRDEHTVRVARVYEDARDLLRLLEPDVRPRRPGIGALVHAVAFGHAAAGDQVAGADVYDVAVRWRHLERADHLGVLDAVGDGPPGGTGVGGLPDAAGGRSDVERARLADHTG